jgi:hypothetical protein
MRPDHQPFGMLPDLLDSHLSQVRQKDIEPLLITLIT